MMPQKRAEIHNYNFGELNIVSRRPYGRRRFSWYIKCDTCGKYHQFRIKGSKIWVAHCQEYGIEWTITPAEYYILKPADFSRILGDI